MAEPMSDDALSSSDSEVEEQNPFSNWTKHPPASWKTIDEESKGSETSPPGGRPAVLANTLNFNEDASEIWGSINVDQKTRERSTVVCAALKRKSDGVIERFVFTNSHASYVAKEQSKYGPMFKKAKEMGYHVIQAEHSHAEGQMIQFLYARSRRYHPVPVAMGGSKPPCSICEELLEILWGKKNVTLLSNSDPVPTYTGKNWYFPPRLQEALEDVEWLGDDESNRARMKAKLDVWHRVLVARTESRLEIESHYSTR